jgi:hypothetical protein
VSTSVPRSIFDFLSGTGRDASGRCLDEILAFSDEELESRHDYIQWLFPLDAPSRAVPGSPVLDGTDAAAIRASHACQANLRRAVERMRHFYEANDHWLVPFDHNHLRITRIIRSLVLLVGRPEAKEFYDHIMSRVEAAGRPVANSSVAFWRNALE